MGGLRRFWGSCRRATVLAPLHINKMDTSTGGPSQQPGPTPAALVLARSGGMPRVGALRLAASSAPTRPVPQRAIAARQEEEQSRLAIGPGNRIRPVGVADSSNTRVEVAAPRGAVMQHRTLVAGDGASAAAGILALPDAGPAAFAAVSLQMRAQRGQTPSAAEWRTMPQLRGPVHARKNPPCDSLTRDHSCFCRNLSHRERVEGPHCLVS